MNWWPHDNHAQQRKGRGMESCGDARKTVKRNSRVDGQASMPVSSLCTHAEGRCDASKAPWTWPHALHLTSFARFLPLHTCTFLSLVDLFCPLLEHSVASFFLLHIFRLTFTFLLVSCSKTHTTSFSRV